MIRHQVYFDTLGSMKEGTPSWRSVFAGLSVLRLVDSYNESSSAVNRAAWAQVHSVRTAIDEITEGNLIRSLLAGVVDVLKEAGAINDSVCQALISYGRALDYEASWALATDVFSTVADFAKPERNARLAVEASVAMGGSARRNGDWEASARAYSKAAFIADLLGDRPGVLTVQIGIANTYLAKGNLPQAQSILNDAIIQARDQEFSEVLADALHAQASLSSRQGNPAEALTHAYEGLGLMTKQASKDVILGDIAGLFIELGLREPARDAYLILVSTAQSQLIRWSATLNLMELAGLDRMEGVFDQYARDLAKAPLGPWLRSHYLLFLGEGLDRFGREDAAIEALEEAVRFAESNQIHQIAFKADSVLSQVRSKTPVRVLFVPPPSWMPDDVGAVVRAMSDLRKASEASAF
jgi:tetratricopeptide (TPR) repeat protein